MVSNIKNNTISETDAKKDLNALNEINVEEIKYKKRTPKQKGLLILFDDLFNIVLTDKTLESERKEKKKKVESKKVESKKEENKHEDDYYEYDDETIDQNKIIKDLNDSLDEIIDKSKSFEDQIKLLKKLEGLQEYFFKKDFDDKELKFKILKIQLVNISNEIDKKLFDQIFGHTLIKLAGNLINTTNKKENQTIVKNINKNKDKLYKKDEFNDLVIEFQQRSDLKYTIDLILNFNEDQLDLV